MGGHAVQDRAHAMLADTEMQIIPRVLPAASDRTLGIDHRFPRAFEVAFPGQSGVRGWIQVRRTANESGQLGCYCVHHFPRGHTRGHALCIGRKHRNIRIPCFR